MGNTLKEIVINKEINKLKSLVGHKVIFLKNFDFVSFKIKKGDFAEIVSFEIYKNKFFLEVDCGYWKENLLFGIEDVRII